MCTVPFCLLSLKQRCGPAGQARGKSGRAWRSGGSSQWRVCMGRIAQTGLNFCGREQCLPLLSASLCFTGPSLLLCMSTPLCLLPRASSNLHRLCLHPAWREVLALWAAYSPIPLEPAAPGINSSKRNGPFAKMSTRISQMWSRWAHFQFFPSHTSLSLPVFWQ